MQDMFFFGYGSLVNAATHGHAPVFAARAKGWRRAWVKVPERDLCYLTAVPDAGCEIDGLIAPVPAGGWAALDAREAAYLRHDHRRDIHHDTDAANVAIYAIAPERIAPPGDDNPILLSYLDTVIQGYLQVYGTSGAETFFETTSGWQAPILNDRAARRYPRATALETEEHALVDAALARLGCRVLVVDG
jgi:hypothetical protein